MTITYPPEMLPSPDEGGEMDQATCARLINDWFTMHRVKADANALAAWLYAGGDTVKPSR